MGDAANREDAEKCIALAKQSLQACNLGRALKFATKAHRLYPSTQSAELLKVLKQKPSDTHDGGADAEPQAGPTARPNAGPANETPDLKQHTSRVLRAKTFYDVLGVSQDATDSDIKKAYRKLALILHPDKAQGARSEEAFKAVSQAFSCLSDREKRAYYDRTGYENPAAAATARPRGPGRQHVHAAADELDPEEIFNMFFGTGIRPSTRVFHTHFAGRAPSARQTPADQQWNMLASMLQLLPLLLIFSYAVMSGFSEPAFSLNNDKYRAELSTNRLQAPFYVKSKRDFDKRYPSGSRERLAVELQVEQQYYELLYSRCQAEKLNQNRMYNWGNREKAKAMTLPNCNSFIGFKEKMHMQHDVF